MPRKKKPTRRELEEAETIGEIRCAYHHLEEARYEFSLHWITWQSGSGIGRDDLRGELRTIEESAAIIREKIATLRERRVAR